MAAIDEVVAKLGQEVSVVVCGDLNSTPSSPLYAYLTDQNGVDFSRVRAQDVSGQEEPPENRYKYRHGKQGELPVDPFTLIQAGYTTDSTFAAARRARQRMDLNRITHNYGLNSAYDNRQPTTVLSSNRECVDYVLHNHRLAVTNVQEKALVF